MLWQPLLHINNLLIPVEKCNNFDKLPQTHLLLSHGNLQSQINKNVNYFIIQIIWSLVIAFDEFFLCWVKNLNRKIFNLIAHWYIISWCSTGIRNILNLNVDRLLACNDLLNLNVENSCLIKTTPYHSFNLTFSLGTILFLWNSIILVADCE